MFQSSSDLLNVVLAFSVLWVAIFLSLALFYLILLLREAHRTVHGVREKTEKFHKALENIREKIENSATYITLGMEGVKELVKYVMDKREEKKERKLTKK